MRKASLAALACMITALGACFIKYDYDEFDGQSSAASGGAGGVGGAQGPTTASSTGGMGGAGGGVGGAGGGTGGEGAGDACGPVCGALYPVGCPSLNCPTPIWQGRFGAADDQLVNGIAADGTQVALVGQYIKNAFDVGTGTDTMQVPPSSAGSMGEDAFLVVLNSEAGMSGGTAKSAMNVDVGAAPRAALGVAIDNGTNFLVTGYTSDMFGQKDAFFANLNPSDMTQAKSVVFGGNGVDKGVAIASDGMGGGFVLGSSSASATKLIKCGSTDVYPVLGMFVARFDGLGNCLWMTQIQGGMIYPAAIAAAGSDVWVTGSFTGSMTFAPADIAMAKGLEAMFVMHLGQANGEIIAKQTYGDNTGGVAATARGNAITIAPNVGLAKVYVAGSVQGKTDFAPQVVDNQTAAFVASFDVDAKLVETVAYPGTTMESEGAFGSGVGFVNGALFLAGTISGQATIDKFSTNIQSVGMHPFVAKIEPTTGSTQWFQVYDGGTESFSLKPFYMTMQGNAPVLAANWIRTISFGGIMPLDPKSTDEHNDIVVAKLSPP